MSVIQRRGKAEVINIRIIRIQILNPDIAAFDLDLNPWLHHLWLVILD